MNIYRAYFRVLLAFAISTNSLSARDQAEAIPAEREEIFELLDVAISEFHKGRLAETVTAYQRALLLLPSSEHVTEGAQLTGLEEPDAYWHFLSAVHDNLGVALFRMRRFEEAEIAIKQGIALDPDRGMYYANLGVCYLHWRRFEEAAEA